MAHDAMMSYNSPNSLSVVHSEEVLELYQDLMEMDPTHSQYYKDEYSLVLLKQVGFFSVHYYSWGESKTYTYSYATFSFSLLQ